MLDKPIRILGNKNEYKNDKPKLISLISYYEVSLFGDSNNLKYENLKSLLDNLIELKKKFKFDVKDDKNIFLYLKEINENYQKKIIIDSKIPNEVLNMKLEYVKQINSLAKYLKDNNYGIEINFILDFTILMIIKNCNKCLRDLGIHKVLV